MEIKNLSGESIKYLKIIVNEVEAGIGETDRKGYLTFINDAGCR